jgi:hypothetical protein
MADAPKTTPPGKQPAPQTEPKIVHKLAVRTLVAVVGLGALFMGLRAFLGYNRDPGSFGSVQTDNMIAAVEFGRDGQQVVAIKPDGSILKSPGYQPGNTERDVAWQPDGSRIYYVSDREAQTFQVYRWRPIEGGESEARTLGTRGKSNPSFAPDAEAQSPVTISSMGTIQELNPVTRATRQVLPPMMNEVPQGTADEEGGGGSSLFKALYGELGDSFARAQILPKGDKIIAIMRGNRGDVLVLQDLAPQSNGRLKTPAPLAAGDRIEFSMAKNGTIVLTVQNFTFATDTLEREFKKVNPTGKLPYRHAVMRYAPDEGIAVLAASLDDKQAYGQPAISPDGTRVMFVRGVYDGTNLTPNGLYIKGINDPLAEAPLVTGQVYEPNWHPGGNRIAYVKREGDKRAIFTANPDGTDEKNLTGDKGDFSRPLFSPQLPK